MSMQAGLFIEAGVAVLLGVTIYFAVRLERCLRGVRLGESELRKTIQELGAATERAERAVAVLRVALEASDAELSSQLRAADRRSIDLKAQIAAGEDVLGRISRIVIATSAPGRLAA